jgi:hypothetical protein
MESPYNNRSPAGKASSGRMISTTDVNIDMYNSNGNSSNDLQHNNDDVSVMTENTGLYHNNSAAKSAKGSLNNYVSPSNRNDDGAVVSGKAATHFVAHFATIVVTVATNVASVGSNFFSNMASNFVPNSAANATPNAAGSPLPRGFSMSGISMASVSKFIKSVCGGEEAIQGLSIEDVKLKYLLPYTNEYQQSYVEILSSGGSSNGSTYEKASIYVIYSWKDMFLDVYFALQHHLRKTKTPDAFGE